MPGISNWPAAPTLLCGICASNLVALPTHGFEANGEIAFSHHELHIAITQAEANIQPNTLADRVDGEPMAGERRSETVVFLQHSYVQVTMPSWVSRW